MPGVPGMRKRTVPKASTRARIWQSMRILRRFTLPDLIATAEATKDNARNYVRGLTTVGVLRVVVPRRSGFKGAYQVWALVRDLGPLPPRLQRDNGVWDPNTHKVLRGDNQQ